MRLSTLMINSQIYVDKIIKQDRSQLTIFFGCKQNNEAGNTSDQLTNLHGQNRNRR